MVIEILVVGKKIVNTPLVHLPALGKTFAVNYGLGANQKGNKKP